MRFVPYAQSPGRRAGQLIGDVLLLVWVFAWIAAGRAIHGATLALAEPGRRLQAGAGGVADSLREAGEQISDAPFVGDDLEDSFASAGEAADALAEAGRRHVEVVENLATLLAVVIAVIPILLAVLIWVPGRVRFARRAAATRRFLDTDADLALFALRAMANQPMHKLARVSDDPVAAWRAGDPLVVRRLALLELRDAGLRLPPA